MPQLSICIPTYNRPDLLERALRSVILNVPADIAERVEVVVSDNSSDDASGRIVRPLLERWPGGGRYVRHDPNVGMVGNFNECVRLAEGRWILILHDDDYLLPGALPSLVATTDRAGEDAVLLFGVRIVTDSGRQLRRQRVLREQRLGPAAGLRRLLSNSSLVRFPAMVIRSDAYEAVGPFDEGMGGFTDIDMWRRLIGRYGLRMVPTLTTAYVIHAEAATEQVFEDSSIATLETIFTRAARQDVLPEAAVRRAQRHWVHQFILAGAFRRLRARDRAGARQVMRLFRLPSVQALGHSPRWLAVRVVFEGLTVGSP